MTDPKPPPIDLPAARAAAEAALARAKEGKPLPVAQTHELAEHTLALVTRSERMRLGAQPDAPTTEDGRLLEQACAALGASRGWPLTRTEIAAKLGIKPGSRVLLSPQRLAKSPLSEERRALLKAWIAGKDAPE